MRYSWIAGIVGMILTVLITGQMLYQQQQTTIIAASDTLNEVVAELKTEWVRTVADLDQMLTGFQYYLELTEQSPEPNLATLRRTMDSLVLSNQYVVSLVVTDATGQVQHWTNSGPKPNLNNRDYFDIHTSNLIEGIAIGNPLPSIMSPGQWVFGASKAVRHADGTLDKVLIAIIDTNRLFRLVENLLLNPHYSLTIFSHSGKVFAHLPDHHTMVGQHHPEFLVTPESSNKQKNRSAIVTINGEKHLLVIYNLNCCQFYIRGQVPLTAVSSPWKNATLIPVAAGSAIALILLWQIICTLLLQQRENRLRAEVDTAYDLDPLTKLPVLLTGEVPPPGNHLQPAATTLILIGPDHFFNFLASFGEQVGDALIAHYADILKSIAPDDSRLYRASGSSFCLLLPEMDQQQALNSAEKLLKDLTGRTFNFDEKETALTSSAGVTLWNGQVSELSSLLQRGTASLAQARKRGGGQTCWLATREIWLERRQQ